MRRTRNFDICCITRYCVFSGIIVIRIKRITTGCSNREFKLDDMLGTDFTPKKLCSMILVIKYSRF